MGLSKDILASILYKQLRHAKASTNSEKEFFIEDLESTSQVYLQQLWLDEPSIPVNPGLTVDNETFIVGTQTILRYRVDAQLDRIEGTQSYRAASINNVINPFKFGNDYEVVFKNSLSNEFNIYDDRYQGEFDYASGILTFYGELPPNVNSLVDVTCHIYEGRDGNDLITFIQETNNDIGETVNSVIDSTAEAAVLLTTGDETEKYLIIDGVSANDTDILFWDTQLESWQYRESSSLYTGYVVWVEDELSSIRRWNSAAWQTISFESQFPTLSDKNIPAVVTEEIFDLATAGVITDIPISDTRINILINGLGTRIANGFDISNGLDTDGKEYDILICNLDTDFSGSTSAANQVQTSSGDYTTMAPVVGEIILLTTAGDTFPRRITAVNGTNIITYDGVSVSGVTSVRKIIVRSHGQVQQGDSIRWHRIYSKYDLITSDWIDIQYVKG